MPAWRSFTNELLIEYSGQHHIVVNLSTFQPTTGTNILCSIPHFGLFIRKNFISVHHLNVRTYNMMGMNESNSALTLPRRAIRFHWANREWWNVGNRFVIYTEGKFGAQRSNGKSTEIGPAMPGRGHMSVAPLRNLQLSVIEAMRTAGSLTTHIISEA